MSVVIDQALYQMVMARLQNDRRTAGLTLDVSSINGCVSLTGLVDTEEQKKAIIWLVEGMHGVRTIHDQVFVRPIKTSI